MTRAFCYQCRRAKVACLCGRIEKQPNDVSVIVLQHPDETNNPKGSAIIAELGLKQYQRWIGEDFSQHEALNQLLEQKASQTVMLFPADQAVELDDAWLAEESREIKYLIVIDATWRKARKIWQLSSNLHAVPAIKFTASRQSDYRIRKIPQEGYLSTIECVVEGLRLLEGRPKSYQSLLDLFNQMIDFQIDKMGESTYQKNYLDK